MDFIEELPEQCPPEKAFRPDGFVVYRLLKKPIIDEKDFESFRKRNPNKTRKEPECIVRSLSVFSKLNSCKKMLKLPGLKKKKGIAKLELHRDDGMIQRTGDSDDHYSWWRSISADIYTQDIISIDS